MLTADGAKQVCHIPRPAAMLLGNGAAPQARDMYLGKADALEWFVLSGTRLGARCHWSLLLAALLL